MIIMMVMTMMRMMIHKTYKIISWTSSYSYIKKYFIAFLMSILMHSSLSFYYLKIHYLQKMCIREEQRLFLTFVGLMQVVP